MRSLETLIPVAEGAIGRVYRTRDAETGEVLAVKRLRFDDPSHIERLRREANAQSRLDHPGICRVLGLEQDDDGQWQLLMEFVDGSTLADELERLTLDQRIEILRQVCEAVDHAHRNDILHRDLKPANVLLRRTDHGWQPVVADFGLALGEDDPALTTTGEILGSPAYMAPEQARGDRDAIGRHTDVFSIGCMLYEALTGQPPFAGATVSDSLDRLLNTEAAHPRTHNPHAPEALSRVALQCLEQSPSRRYASAADVGADLKRWIDRRTVHARRYTRLYRMRRAIHGRPVESTAIGLAAIALLGLLAWGVDTARTAGIREASAATLGTALADVRGRMTIARLAPAHDIGSDRAALRAELERLADEQSGQPTTADLLHATLGGGYLEIGDLARAEDEAERALALRETPATRSIRARTLLARYAVIAAAVMDLPASQRDERLAAARKTYLAPAEALILPLEGSKDEPEQALVRLAIVERRFDEAETRVGALGRQHPQDYTPELLVGALRMEQAEQALENAERDRAAELFEQARDTFERVTRIGRSDPRPRLQACRAARGHLRATLDRGGPFPKALDGLHRGCDEVAMVDPGNPDTHAGRSAAWGTLAEAFEGINSRDAARDAVRKGLVSADRALEYAPGHPIALEQKARLHLRMAGLEPDPWTRAQAQFDAAANAAERLKTVRPEDPAGELLIALVERDRARNLELHGQADAALASLGRAQVAFESVLEQTPDSVVALSGASLNAVFHFYEYRPSDPDRAVRWMERAIELQDRALALDPDNVDLLFDQGANHGDLWYYLLLTPEVEAEVGRADLLERALDLLGRIRTLAPARPSGYSQPIMILLSGADYRIDHELDAGAELERALDLQQSADRAGVMLDRNIPAWIQLARARNALNQGVDPGPIFEAAFATLVDSEVDSTDSFYLQMHRLELVGLYQRWLREAERPPDADRFEQAHIALDDLLANDRRQAGVLCSGGRMLLEDVLSGRADAEQALARSERLFEECLATDDDFTPRYGADLEQVRALRDGEQEIPPAGAD